MASIIRKGRKYVARVRRDGVNKSRSFHTKADAMAWAEGVEFSARRKSRFDKPEKLTLEDIILRYILEVKPYKPWGRSKSAALDMLREGMGKVRLDKLDSDHIVQYVKRRHRDGAQPQTIAPEVSYLGAVLRIAGAVWKLDFDRAAHAEAREVLKMLNLTGRSNQRERRPSEDELAKLRAHFDAKRPGSAPMSNIMDFAIETAMRMSEILSLRWDDYDAQARTILIRDRKHPQKKLGNDMRVPLLGKAQALLEAQPRSGPLVFPYTKAAISAAFTRACKALSIDDLHFHDLRHHACSLLFEQGYQIQEVALVSGHKDWAQLKRYTHIKPEMLHRDKPKPAPHPAAKTVKAAPAPDVLSQLG